MNHWPSILLFCLFAISGFALPLAPLILSPNSTLSTLKLDDIGKMMLIGIPSAIISTGLYICLTFINTRQKYVVLPFEVEADDKEKGSLVGVASQLQHGIVSQIQKIGLLLQLRQIENLHTSPEIGLTRFVASGQGLEFTEELRAVSLLDTPVQGFNSTLSRFMLYIVNTFAIVKVQGKIRQRSDNSLQIWIELYRKGQSFPIDMVIIPTNFSEDIDELTIQDLSRSLATKLVQKIGNNYHLGSSWESLDSFLEGIAAAVEGNWWRAIDLYRTAIQIEEASQGSFALGHYHLGSALVSVGELEEGIRQLEQAEYSDPLFAETRYMLALTRIYKHWNKLNEMDIEFQKAKQNCAAALKLRHQFAEAYHLLGSAHYQRGRLAERTKTRAYNRPDNNVSSESIGSALVDFTHEYKESAKFLRHAIKIYDRELRRISRNLTWHNDVEIEMRRILRARMTATHQLGDALSAQHYYAEADTYYEDFNMVYPNNIRTLVAMTKMYCLAGQWQRADEHLSHYVFSIPESHWNADVNLHAGWALSGGIYEMDELLWGYLYRKYTYEDRIDLLTQATQHIDYAIHQRPQYITRWSQTDWQTDYNAACIAVQRYVKKPSNFLRVLLDQLSSSSLQALRDRLLGEIKKRRDELKNQAESLLAEGWKDEDKFADIQRHLDAIQERITKEDKYHKIISEVIRYSLRNRGDKNNHIEHIRQREGDQNKDATTYIEKISRLYWDPIPYIKEEVNNVEKTPKKNPFTVNVLRSWLSARMNMCLYHNEQDPISELWLPAFISKEPNLESELEFSQSLYPNPDFADIYKLLKEHYANAAMLLQKIDESERFSSLATIWYKLKLAAEALDNWKLAQTKESFYTSWNGESISRIHGMDDAKTTITFADRWTYAVFISVSTFATRWLIEAEAYEVAWKVAQISIAHLTEWRDIHRRKEQLSIAPFVFRYARATLYAYKAYCAIQMEDNAETQERLEAQRLSSSWVEYKDIASKAIVDAPEDVQTALHILPRHPLAMFVLAHLHRRNKLTEDAALEFGRLANVIESFDPIDFLANWEMIKKTDINRNAPKELEPIHWSNNEWSKYTKTYHKFQESNQYKQWQKHIPEFTICDNKLKNKNADNDQPTLRDKLELQEKVIGQGQIATFVDKSQVHGQLARIYELQKKIDLTISHLTQAAIWSKRRELEIEYLMIQVEQLERLDRFKDAQSVSKILRSRQIQLEPQAFTIAKIRQPDVLACIMDSRMKEYPRALSTAHRLFTQWATIESYKPLQTPKETIENVSSAYYNNGLDHPDLIWFYKQIQFFLYDIRQELESFDSSIRSLIPQNIFVLAKSDEYGVDLRLVLCALANNYLVSNNMAKLFAKLIDQPWIKKHPPERTINKIILEKKINEMREEQPRINIGWNISTRIIHSLCEESLQILEQYCQLLNIIVYDRIELNLEHSDGQAYTTQNMPPVNSVSKMASLASPLNQSNQAAIEDAINIMTVLLRFANEQWQEHNYASRYRENLRNYYDTKGWMLFRSVFPYQRFEPGGASISPSQAHYDSTKQVKLQVLLNQFEQARHWLTKGLSYDPSNAILYYHLARVHLAIMERLWQSRKSTKASDIADIAAMFQDHLRQAASCWRRALNYDTSGRLRSSLNWLGQRIEQYSRDWKYRFLSSLRHGLPNDTTDE